MLVLIKLSKNSQHWLCLACNFPLCRNQCVWGFHQGASLVNQLCLLKEAGTECCQACLVPEVTQRHHLLLFGGWVEQCVLPEFVQRPQNSSCSLLLFYTELMPCVLKGDQALKQNQPIPSTSSVHWGFALHVPYTTSGLDQQCWRRWGENSLCPGWEDLGNRFLCYSSSLVKPAWWMPDFQAFLRGTEFNLHPQTHGNFSAKWDLCPRICIHIWMGVISSPNFFFFFCLERLSYSPH